MATPLAARPFEQAIDPRDWADFYVYFNQGAPDAQIRPFLLFGEGIASYELSLTPEAVAAGLMIREDGAYAPKLVGNLLMIWLKIADDMQDDDRFDANGVVVGIEVTVVTTNNPPRRKQRTFLCKVVNL